MSKSRKVSVAMKKRVAGRQNYQCANKLNVQLKGIENYKCPFWRNKGSGNFDESGYDIDHIIELSESGNNDQSNLQALCINCHRVKTSRFMTIKKSYKKVYKSKKKYKKISKVNYFDEQKKDIIVPKIKDNLFTENNIFNNKMDWEKTTSSITENFF